MDKTTHKSISERALAWAMRNREIINMKYSLWAVITFFRQRRWYFFSFVLCWRLKKSLQWQVIFITWIFFMESHSACPGDWRMFNSSCYRGFSSFRILSFSEAEVGYLSEYRISIKSGAGGLWPGRQQGGAPFSPQSAPAGVHAGAGEGWGLVWPHEGSLSRGKNIVWQTGAGLEWRLAYWLPALGRGGEEEEARLCGALRWSRLPAHQAGRTLGNSLQLTPPNHFSKHLTLMIWSDVSKYILF